MQDIEALPLYSEDLLEHLDKSFGSYTPVPPVDEQVHWYREGQKSVVEHLKRLKEQGDEIIMDQ